MKIVIKFLLLIYSICLVAGCATLPAPNAPHNYQLTWKIRQQQLSSIDNWTIHGLAAINDRQQHQSANVTWIQKGQNYTISLFGPLGMNGGVLYGTAQAVTLEQENGKKITGKSAEQLMQRALGWQLPISNLHYWVRGLPAPNLRAHIQFDTYHHITALQQQGWRINYLHYTGVQQFDLPSEIRMQNQQLRVHLVLSRWQL